MTPPAVLFVHGGGDEASRYDRRIADRLQVALGPQPTIRFPQPSGLERLDWAAAKIELEAALADLPPGSTVVAHSLGAASMLKLLIGKSQPNIAQLLLLAPPYEGADGQWGDGDFSFPVDFAQHLPQGLPITLWHSRDDDIIAPEDARRYAEKLGAGKVILLDGHGHQFRGDLAFLADAIRGEAP